MISCLPWKHNSRHEAGEEVLLSEEPPTPSMTPEVTPQPPRSPQDPKIRDVRQFYVKPYDLNPDDGGIGYTDGCPGCKSIVYGTEPRQAHSNKCRHRVIKTASTNKDVAARVTRTIDRDVEYHAKRLETDKEGKRKSADEEALGEKKVKEPRREGTEPEVQVPFQENQSHTPSSSSSQTPSNSSNIKVKNKFDSRKKEVRIKSEGTGGVAPTGPTQPTQEDPQPRTPVAPQVYQMPSGRTFRLRPRGEEEESARPSKTQRLEDDEDLGMGLMEALEERSQIRFTSRR
jgi:hypothetical protein